MSEVQAIIDENAKLEFECLWREHERTGARACVHALEITHDQVASLLLCAGIPRSTLTDTLSQKITDLSARIEDNDTLWANDALRNGVLRSALPKVCCSQHDYRRAPKCSPFSTTFCHCLCDQRVREKAWRYRKCVAWACFACTWRQAKLNTASPSNACKSAFCAFCCTAAP